MSGGIQSSDPPRLGLRPNLAQFALLVLFYNVQLMLAAVLRHAGVIGACGSCLDARGIRHQELVEEIRRSSMEELTVWTLGADKVISF